MNDLLRVRNVRDVGNVQPLHRDRRWRVDVESAILIHRTAFHDEEDSADGGDVLERITIDSDEVGVHPGSNGADAVAQA